MLYHYEGTFPAGDEARIREIFRKYGLHISTIPESPPGHHISCEDVGCGNVDLCDEMGDTGPNGCCINLHKHRMVPYQQQFPE